MSNNDEAVKVLDLVGIRPVFVDDLGGEDAMVDLRHRVVLLDKALRADDIADIVDQVVDRVIAATVESLTATPSKPRGRRR